MKGKEGNENQNSSSYEYHFIIAIVCYVNISDTLAEHVNIRQKKLSNISMDWIRYYDTILFYCAHWLY